MSLDRVHRSGTNSEACQEGHIAEIHLQSHVQMGAGLLVLLLDLFYTCVNGYKSSTSSRSCRVYSEIFEIITCISMVY